jgi:2-polyprenyl-3-methyl-5-hydroxy-6-metoxy-1,4-benzoquinol methylase
MRDHNKEYQDGARKYAYEFDFMMHRYMIRTFKGLFRGGKALEIGCYKGDMTELLADEFSDLTVLEAADSLIDVARKRVSPAVRFVHGLVETAEFGPEFEAIFLVHTLEHLDDAVAVLSRIGNWLTAAGRLYVVVPNGNAMSRQIAVQMGLIESNSAVTAAEFEHGHRRTYTLDTLERDARSAGLLVSQRGGVCFKPFANFQFDLMLSNKIIDERYLEGCFDLGMKYPDLAASIYVVCQKA